MNRAVFYRHWLEIRGGLAVTAIATALVAAVSILVVATSTGSDLRFALPTHAWMTAIAGVIASIVVTGTGIRTNDFQPGHPSFQYTLTLPVDRASWILTRFGTGVVATLAPVAAIFIVDVGALFASGNDVPVSAMVRTSVAIGLFAVMAGTLFGVVLPLGRDWLQPVGATLFFSAFVIFASNAVNNHTPSPGLPRPVETLATRPPDPWTMAAATVLVVAGLVWIGVTIARKNDF